MNCDELRKNIENLKDLCNYLQENYDRMNNELSGKSDFKNNYSKTKKQSDELLEKYLPNFIEKNPELTAWELGKKINYPKDYFGEEITGDVQPKRLSNGDIIILADSHYKNNDDNNKRMVFKYNWDESNGLVLEKNSFEINQEVQTLFTSLPDGTVIAGGGALLYEIKDDGGTFLTINQSSVGGYKDNACITDVAPLPNGNMLVGGVDRTLYEVREHPSLKKWEIVKSLCSDIEMSPTSIVQMPDGAMLVGCVGGFYEYGKDNNGNWSLSERIECNDIIENIFQLSNDKMLLVGYDSLQEYNKGSDGKWRLEEKHNQLKAHLRFAVQLPNNEIIIVGEDKVFSYRKFDDGWKLIENKAIEEVYSGQSNAWPPDFIIPLSNDEILVGGTNYNYDTHSLENIMILLYRPKLSLNGLKRRLNTIIEKGDSNELR